MRVLSRVALVVVLAAISLPGAADHLESECPLTLAGSNAATTDFALSPHGAFRDGAVLYVLRGQTLSTYTAQDFGELAVIREDFLGTLGARDVDGGIAYQNGFLYVSGETGLEIYDLRQTGTGAAAPVLVSRTAGLHYKRLAVNGSLLAGLNPAPLLPCAPGSPGCSSRIDLISVSNLQAPTVIATLGSSTGFGNMVFNDLAFNQGFLYVATNSGVIGYNVLAPTTPNAFTSVGTLRTTYLVSNSNGTLGLGNDEQIHLYSVSSNGVLQRFSILVIPFGLTIDRANPIAFHPQAWADPQSGRLITMVNEINPLTLKPARTIAFVVFDYSIPMWEGSFERVYEDITRLNTDEVKYNPLSAGNGVFTIGELSGLQLWTGCGAPSGKIEWFGPQGLTCGGAELRGWVTGPQRITNVEVFLDGESLGTADLGRERNDVSSKFPVTNWTIRIDLDDQPRGVYRLRAVATDALGVRRQFAEHRIFLNGPGMNCTNRRRAGR